MKGIHEIPWWLKGFDRVRAEFRNTPFPRKAEEGLRQCAELSAVSMELLKNEIRKRLRHKDEERVKVATRLLLARLSHIDYWWKAYRDNDRLNSDRR